MDRILFRRVVFFVISVFVMSLGVVISTKAFLGTSPISSVPNVISIGTGYSLGTVTLIFNVLVMAAAIVIAGKEHFRAACLLSMVMVLIFSVLCDLWASVLSFMETDNYVVQWALIVLAAIVLSFGIALELVSNITMMAGEYFVVYSVGRFRIEFARMKIIFDIGNIVLAIAFSLYFFGTFVGVREGTVFAALMIGPMVRMHRRYLERLGLDRYLGRSFE